MTDTEYHTIPVGNFVHVVGTMWEVAFGGIRAFPKPSTDTTHYKNGADRIVLQEPVRGNGFFKNSTWWELKDVDTSREAAINRLESMIVLVLSSELHPYEKRWFSGLLTFDYCHSSRERLDAKNTRERIAITHNHS